MPPRRPKWYQMPRPPMGWNRSHPGWYSAEGQQRRLAARARLEAIRQAAAFRAARRVMRLQVKDRIRRARFKRLKKRLPHDIQSMIG